MGPSRTSQTIQFYSWISPVSLQFALHFFGFFRLFSYVGHIVRWILRDFEYSSILFGVGCGNILWILVVGELVCRHRGLSRFLVVSVEDGGFGLEFKGGLHRCGRCG
jgi:hypothetical protein